MSENNPGTTPPYPQQPGPQASAPIKEQGLTQPLPNDLSTGWLPEDMRQHPLSPLPAPKLFGLQTLLPFKFLNSIRHPAEFPLVIMAYALTFLIYIGGGIYLISSFISFIATGVESTGMGISNLMGQLIAIAIYLPILFFFARGLMYAQLRLSGVRITPTQFPEAYQMVVEAAHAAGLRRVPDAYVVLGNGMINAFASGHGHRRFIAIYSDLFEIGGAARNPEALRFIIGHEVGHITAGHTSYFRLIFTSFFMQIPVAGKLLSRTQEYTADNFGYRYAPDGAETTTCVLAAGKYLMNDVNFHELANRAVYEGGFFTWVANLNSTHPPVTWRAHALRDRTEPGRLMWRPKNNPPYPLSMIPAAEPAEAWADPLQATDHLATYPERADNQHWGSVNTTYRRPAQYRDRTVGDMLYSGWVPPQFRQPAPPTWAAPVPGGQGPHGQDDAAPKPPAPGQQVPSQQVPGQHSPDQQGQDAGAAPAASPWEGERPASAPDNPPADQN
ncbi:M48 family metallopeptidase [Rothia nasimurium]|uniref:M48 family metallopeptidase n=1 Tax=Rothia nasimurium TaxID=85336 RepID=UPI001F000479|nr:M48 family metallopeptidase [Rothia nasimurium]